MTQSPTPEELEGLLERATKGPWRVVISDMDAYVGSPRPGNEARIDDVLSWENGHNNAALIAAMHTAIPSLLARIRAQDERIRVLEEALENIDCAAAVSHNGTETRTLTYILEVTKGILDPARAALTLNKENDDAG